MSISLTFYLFDVSLYVRNRTLNTNWWSCVYFPLNSCSLWLSINSFIMKFCDVVVCFFIFFVNVQITHLKWLDVSIRLFVKVLRRNIEYCQKHTQTETNELFFHSYLCGVWESVIFVFIIFFFWRFFFSTKNYIRSREMNDGTQCQSTYWGDSKSHFQEWVLHENTHLPPYPLRICRRFKKNINGEHTHTQLNETSEQTNITYIDRSIEYPTKFGWLSKIRIEIYGR